MVEIILWVYISLGLVTTYSVAGIDSKEACEEFAKTAPGRDRAGVEYKCVPYKTLISLKSDN